MDNKPAKLELTKEIQKDYSQLRWNIFIFAFSFTVIFLVSLLAASFGIRVWYANHREEKTITDGTLEDATWAVQTVIPSSTGDGTVSLTVVSSIGNIRTYSGVRSYGISNNGQTLAVSTDTNFKFIDLASNSEKALLLPFAYAGDRGEAISWSPTDEEIAIIVTNVTDGNIDLLMIIDRDGEEVARVKDDFAYFMQDGEKVYYPPKFSPTSKLVLTRTFEDEEKAADLDPANLKIFNILGGLRKEIAVRDGVTKSDQIIYFWNTEGDTVLFSADPIGTEPNYSKEFEFEQSFVDF